MPSIALPASPAQSPQNPKVAAAVSTRAEPVLTRHLTPLYALTGLRFFAASYVIILHSRLNLVLLAHGYYSLSRLVSNGYLAVTLFFMLSGFILAYNYRGQIKTRNHIFRFWEARFARIWPAYVFSLLCSSIPLSGVPTFWLSVATIGMVQAWNPFHPDYAIAWNFVCWSLSVEGFFYLVFPFLQRLTERLRLAQLLWLGLSITILGVLWNTPYHSFTSRYPGPWFYIPAPLIHLPTFIAGVTLGNLFHRWKPEISSLPSIHKHRVLAPLVSNFGRFASRSSFPVFTLTGLVAALYLLCTAHGSGEGLLIPAFALLILGLASEATTLSRILSTRLLVLGGEISYAMYLLRPPVQKWIIAYPALHNNPYIDYLYVPLLVIPISLLSFYCIEAPSRRALRRIFSSVQNRRA